MAETKVIRESIESQFGDLPIDKDVVVLYESDKEQQGEGVGVDRSSLNVADRLLVEIPKERPAFFSPNLLQKSTIGLNRRAKDVTTTNPVPIVHKTESS